MNRILMLFAWLGLAGCHSVLQGELDEREANAILLVLAEAGIEAHKRGQGAAWTLEVDRADLSAAFRVLSTAGYPRPKRAGFMEVYRERGLVPGRMEEHALFVSALQEEIAKTIESVEGVVSARVHVTVKPDGRVQRVEPHQTTASVLVCYHVEEGGQPPISADAVRKIVGNAVAGLSPELVEVVFAPRRQVMLPDRLGGPVGSGAVTRVAAALVAALALLVSAWFFIRRPRPRLRAQHREARTT